MDAQARGWDCSVREVGMTYPSKKRCCWCNRELPRDTEHFYRASSSGDGLQARCIDCDKQYKADRSSKNGAHELAAFGPDGIRRHQKICPKCCGLPHRVEDLVCSKCGLPRRDI